MMLLLTGGSLVPQVASAEAGNDGIAGQEGQQPPARAAFAAGTELSNARLGIR